MGISIRRPSALTKQMPQAKKLIIVKLGGSVITHKSSVPPKVNIANLTLIAKEIKDYTGKLILVLGGGAHGHQAAHSYGYSDVSTDKRQLIRGIPHIRHNMSILSLEVESILKANNLQSVILSPFSLVLLNDRIIESFAITSIQRTIDSGIIVILHGDVCFDNILGASILSGDTIAAYLAKRLKANALYMGTDVDGIFEGDPHLDSSAKLVPLIDQSNKEQILRMAGPSSATDVTGGMTKKLQELFWLSNSGIDIAIFNLQKKDVLSGLLRGRKVLCTRIAI
ncbi:MAG: hypothetical protein EAX81_02900 [Candidatus Thorarchaeota archaeon]|nr:hypothetical protein [Candidatus Thorarchaeota archaeon]